ncbi:MAG: hypothetical protein LBR35_01045, partial [Rickettsiales bacterium]|nr:hypothetical protein [Rickettsiales bacterium]
QKAALQGLDFATALKQVTTEELQKLNMIDSSTDISNIDIYDIYLGEVSNNTVRKEGNALLKEAQTNCATILELCPASKTNVQASYETLVGNSCRTYSRQLDSKLRELQTVQQNAYNQYQMAEAQYNISTNNKYNSEMCATELYACMEKDAICGAGFENCYNAQILANMKISCQSVLNQCQSANANDAVWNAFVNVALARSQLSSSQCYEQSVECVVGVCGEDFSKCLSSGTPNTAEVQTRANAACGDVIRRCASTQTSGNVTTNVIWESVINKMISDNLTNASSDTVYAQLNSCMANACGTGYVDCKTAAAIDAKKSVCQPQLNRLGTDSARNNMWNNLRTSILQSYGYKDSECIGMVESNLKAICGNDYSGCGTQSSINSAKTTAMSEPSALCGWDMAKQNGVWNPIKERIDLIAQSNALQTAIANCDMLGSLYVFNVEDRSCKCKYTGQNGNCVSLTEYQNELAVEIQRQQNLTDLATARAQAAQIISTQEAQIAQVAEETKIANAQASQKANCATQNKEWSVASSACCDWGVKANGGTCQTESEFKVAANKEWCDADTDTNWTNNKCMFMVQGRGGSKGSTSGSYVTKTVYKEAGTAVRCDQGNIGGYIAPAYGCWVGPEEIKRLPFGKDTTITLPTPPYAGF